MALEIGATLGNAFGGIGKGAGQIMIILGKFIPAFLIGVILAAAIWFFFLEDLLFFKHRVKLKKVVGNGFKWIDDKAMEKRLKNGAKIWQLKKLKVKIGLPPDDVLIVGQGGALVAEGWLVNDNQIIWSKDEFDLKSVSKEAIAAMAKAGRGEELSEADRKLLKFKADFQPISTNDRVVIADAMQEADFGKKDLSKLLEKAIPWIVVIVLFVLVIFGFKYYAGPLNDYGKAMVGVVAPIAENNKVTAEYLYAIHNDIQLIREDVNFLKEKNKLDASLLNRSVS